MKMRVSCIIPAYNEGKNILKVLSAMTKVKSLKEIAVIDDGSMENWNEIVKKHFPSVKYVREKQNRGKSAAIGVGLEHCRGEVILLFDADYYGFDPKKVEWAIKYFEKNDLTMFIFQNAKNYSLHKRIRVDVVLSGQRIIRREILEEVFKQGEVSGYQLEVAINSLVLKKKGKVRYSKLIGNQELKFEKRGWKNGISEDIKMIREVLKYQGLLEYAKQLKADSWYAVRENKSKGKVQLEVIKKMLFFEKRLKSTFE